MNAESDGDGLREILSTLFGHWRLIVGLALLVAVCATVFAVLQSKVWESSVRMVVQQNRQVVHIGTSEAPVNGPMLLSQGEQVRTEMEIFASPAVLAAAATALGPERVMERMRWRWDWLRELPNKWIDAMRDGAMGLLIGHQPQAPATPLQLAMRRLRDHLDAQPVRESSVFRITAIAPDPAFSAEMLNSVVRAYLANHLRVRQGAATSGIFKAEADRAAKELEEAVASAQQLKARAGIVEAPVQKQLLLQRLSEAEAAYQRNQLEASELKRKVGQAERELRQRAPVTAVQDAVGRNPEHDDLQQQLSRLEIERANYHTGSAVARALDAEIDAFGARLRETRERVQTDQVQGPNTTFLDIERSLIADRARLQALGSGEELRAQIARDRDALQALDANAAALQDATRDVALKEEALKVIQRKEQEERLGSLLNERRVTDVVPIEAALPPDRPVGPGLLVKALIGLGSGLLAGLGLAFLAEYLRRTIQTREEAAAQLGQPVLASLVDTDTTAGAAALNQIELRHLAETLRLEAGSAGRGVAVLVASTSQGEGKTTLARALMRVLGNDESVCVLVDASSGRPPTRPALASDTGPATEAEVAATRQMLQALCAKSRLVIVDGPALGSFADGLWLPEVADATLLVLQCGRTTGINALRTLRTLQAGGGRCLGVVLTRRRFVIPGWVYGWLLSPRLAMHT